MANYTQALLKYAYGNKKEAVKLIKEFGVEFFFERLHSEAAQGDINKMVALNIMKSFIILEHN